MPPMHKIGSSKCIEKEAAVRRMRARRNAQDAVFKKVDIGPPEEPSRVWPLDGSTP